ncbi:DNA cytosine methyltransferase [Pseudomonas syringae]|uniref:DNA cytosine methyltransferase n=1 Tax=Pseudomonas syringae TaxID=317 RepID=UPI003F774B34
MSFTNSDINRPSFSWAEFFAGGGMARAGLGASWDCVFSNDNDEHKVKSYMENWSSDHLLHGDIKTIQESLVPDNLTMAWASSPCQNFSSAGLGDGLLGASSSVFVKWWDLIATKALLNTSPKIIVIENVAGLLNSRNGLDFEMISKCFITSGYFFGVVMMDAIHFLPQSRPRIFIVAVRSEYSLPYFLTLEKPSVTWHPPHLVRAIQSLPESLRARHVWWSLPQSIRRTSQLVDFISSEDEHISWHTEAQTLKLLQSMTKTNLDKINNIRSQGTLSVGTLYRRMRTINGIRSSRAEVRFDGVAGCLRASTGGSSRQILLFVEGEFIRTRQLTPREAARLMGLPDTYKLPRLKTHAAKLVGDGVAVPVVRFLEEHLLNPLAVVVTAWANTPANQALTPLVERSIDSLA